MQGIERPHGEAQSLGRSCSVTPELFAVSRFNEEGRCSQGDYSLLENNCPCISPRGGKLLAGDSGGTSITSSVGRKALAENEKARKFEALCLTNEKLRTGNKSNGFFSWLKPTGMR